MKRKLIEFDAFQKIKTESLSNAEQELKNASGLLGEALELDGLHLTSFGSDKALFESIDGDFVQADYQIKNGYVQFDNVEQLVINEETEISKSKEIISKMIDSLIESDETKANEFFNEWFDLPRTKRVLNEVKKMRVVPIRKRVGGKTKVVGYKKARWNVTPHSHESASKTAKRMRNKKINQRRMTKGVKKFLAQKRARLRKSISEWNLVAGNVSEYIDLMENGPCLDNCQVLRNNGDIVGIKIPTTKLRNEAKLLKFNWKTLNTDVVVKRSQSKKLHENEEFVKEIKELKTLNALSDSKATEEQMENVATKFSNAIYLTESELSNIIKIALESINATNFDDNACDFLSEGILRTIHENFSSRVSKIVKLAGANLNENSNDKYAEFKSIAENYYANLDESTSLEMQAFVDVYEALRQVHDLAKEEENEDVANETAYYLDDLLKMIQNESELSFDVLSEATEWLFEIVEATMPEEWKVKEPVVNPTGDHPELHRKAKATQSPESCGKTLGNQPASDGKNDVSSELADDGWGNIGGENIYPSLDNPYVPKSLEPKISGEKDVDSDSGQLAHWGDNDTWPNLQNPYCKKTSSEE